MKRILLSTIVLFVLCGMASSDCVTYIHDGKVTGWGCGGNTVDLEDATEDDIGTVTFSYGYSDDIDTYHIDAKSKAPLQLDVAIRFNAIPPALAIQIMNHLKEMYGIDGISKEACKLEFDLE